MEAGEFSLEYIQGTEIQVPNSDIVLKRVKASAAIKYDWSTTSKIGYC